MSSTYDPLRRGTPAEASFGKRPGHAGIDVPAYAMRVKLALDTLAECREQHMPLLVMAAADRAGNQRALADVLGVTERVVSGVSTGRAQASPHFIEAVVNLLCRDGWASSSENAQGRAIPIVDKRRAIAGNRGRRLHVIAKWINRNMPGYAAETVAGRCTPRKGRKLVVRRDGAVIFEHDATNQNTHNGVAEAWLARELEKRRAVA